MVSPPLPATLGPLTSLATTQGTCCSLYIGRLGPFSTSPRQVEQGLVPRRDKQLLPHPKTLWRRPTCCSPCGEEAAAAPCWAWFQVVPDCSSSCATSECPGRAQAGMASSTWLAQSCSLGTLVCPLCDGEGTSCRQDLACSLFRLLPLRVCGSHIRRTSTARRRVGGTW